MASLIKNLYYIKVLFFYCDHHLKYGKCFKSFIQVSDTAIDDRKDIVHKLEIVLFSKLGYNFPQVIAVKNFLRTSHARVQSGEKFTSKMTGL